MKALVLGGSGFIGSHVAEALLAAGHDVTIYDLSRPPAEVGATWVEGSTLNRELIRETIAGHDFVYNFAGVAHLDIGLRSPIETVEQNILATVISLDAARQSGVSRYVYASSIYVYSEGGSFYRCSKQAAELYVEEYQRLHGLDYTILRFGTVYGPRADQHNSVRRYLRQALFDRRIQATGTGDEVREYIHVRDAASSSVKVLEPEFANQTIVLTGHHPMKFLELLRLIQEIVGSDVEVKLEPADPNDPKVGSSGHYRLTPYHFKPKIARKLVSNPYLDLGQGLLEMLQELSETGSPAAE